MSNNLCQSTAQFASFNNEFKSLPIINNKDSALVDLPSANSQHQILEQLLFALTNQMTIAVGQNKNINQHFSLVQPNFTEFSVNDADSEVNNNNQSYVNEVMSLENSNKTNKHIESFNLDTHLDLNRYNYFNSQHEKDEVEQSSTEPDIQLESCLSVDCNIPSSSSCQLSSSSSSSSNSSLSNICKSKQPGEKTKSDSTKPSQTIDLKARNAAYLTKGKLSGRHSSSSDCLSSDEGYFGSYSDSKNFNHENKINSAAGNQQEQVILLKYLLQNQHMTQLNNLEALPANEQRPSDEANKQINAGDIPWLNIFNSTQPEEEQFTTLISNSQPQLIDEQVTKTQKFDVISLLSSSEKNFTNIAAGTLETLALKKEIIDILDEQKLKRCEQEKLEELELRTLNWRKFLDKRTHLQKIKRELNEEDQIDAGAYLNEIEMNLDYFQSSAVDAHAVHNDDEDVLIDTLLKFRTNKMAFNLRQYHESIEKELNRRRINRENYEKMLKLNMFANVHVDSIPEFTPYSQDQFYDFEPEEPIDLAQHPDEYDQLYTHHHHDLDENQQTQQLYEELPVDHHYQLLAENDYTMVDENNDVYDENGYLISESSHAAIMYDDDIVEAVDFVDSADSEYQYEEDYEDYEDQIMIDSLSEQDALNLLRNESEMYALQMAQASKSGLLPKSSKSQRKKKGRFNSGTSSTTTQSTETSGDSKSESTSSNVDIFENVFNFEEVMSVGSTSGSNSDLASSSASVSGATESEIVSVENFDLDINEFLMPQSVTGNISMSLRNSLLKLRHTRRHLAKLIDSKKPASDSGSTSSSLTNPSTPVGQFTKQITVSSLSRKPCVYMLNEGRCMRADCRFAHDLKQITCKYWIDGECLKGDNCEFLHELIEECIQPLSSKALSAAAAKKAPKAIVIKKKDFKLDTEEFPALGGAPNVPKTCEFPPLGASPISIIEQIPIPVTIKKSSPEPATLVVKSPQPTKTNLSLFKTAASVLKASNTSVNLVQNKPQPATTVKAQNNNNNSNRPRDQAKSQNITVKQQQHQKSSCGTSPSSFSESLSRSSSLARSNNKK